MYLYIYFWLHTPLVYQGTHKNGEKISLNSTNYPWSWKESLVKVPTPMIIDLTRSFMRLRELEAWRSETSSILSYLDDSSLAVVEKPFHLLLLNVDR